MSRKGPGSRGIHFFLRKVSSISHELKQKLTGHRVPHMCPPPPASTTGTVCTETKTRKTSPTEIWSKNRNTWHDGSVHKSECTGLVVVGGCISSLLHLQSLFGKVHMRSASCMCTSNSCFTLNLPDWAKIDVHKRCISCSPGGGHVPQFFW